MLPVKGIGIGCYRRKINKGLSCWWLILKWIRSNVNSFRNVDPAESLYTFSLKYLSSVIWSLCWIKTKLGFYLHVFVLYTCCSETRGMKEIHFSYGFPNLIEFQLEIKAPNLKFAHEGDSQVLFNLKAG